MAREGLNVTRLKVSTEVVPNSKLETLWAMIKPKAKRQIIVGIVYRPPRRNVPDIEADFSDLELQFQYLRTAHPLTKIVVYGDLNCDWLMPNTARAKSALLNFVTDYSLVQCVSTPTYSTGSLLDVLLTTSSEVVQQCFTVFCDFSPHKFVFAHINIPRCRIPRRIIQSRCLRRIDREALNLDLYLADWENVFAASTVSLKWEVFLEIFLSIFDKHAPVRTIRIRNARAPPVTEETKQLMFRRRAALSAGGHCSAEYKTLNRAVRSAIRRDTCLDMERRIREEGLNSIWRAAKSAVGSKTAERKLPGVSPDCMNEYFVSVGPRVADEVRDTGETPDLPCRLPRVGACALELSPLTLSELRDIVFHMNGSATCGGDGISIQMIRISFDTIGMIFLHLVNSSISLSETPSAWKHSLVIPIHKSGELSMPSNYRPISIVPVIAKIVERAVHQQVYCYLSQNHLLSPTQHGFRPRHSTETALISISDRILSANDRGEISLLCMLDLSKCFDVIDHSKLLSKLQLHGIDISWFSDYLRDHTQSVTFADIHGNIKSSAPLPNRIGVFQGSSLGPLLYSIFANDLSLYAEDAMIVQYADDTQILISGKKSETVKVVRRMEQALASLDLWFRANGLKVNASKTQLMLLGSSQCTYEKRPQFRCKISR